MTEYAAIIKQTAQTYTRKKDGQPGLIVKAVLENNQEITLYGNDGDRLLLDRTEGEMVMVTKNGNFYRISSVMNEEGEFAPVERSQSTQTTQTPQTTPKTAKDVYDRVDPEEIKTYIRWHSKILAYCYEQNPDHGDLLYQQACKQFGI